MTRAEKIEWLEKATGEQLLKQYEVAFRKYDKDDWHEENIEDYELVRAEVLKRMSK